VLPFPEPGGSGQTYFNRHNFMRKLLSIIILSMFVGGCPEDGRDGLMGPRGIPGLGTAPSNALTGANDPRGITGYPGLASENELRIVWGVTDNFVFMRNPDNQGDFPLHVHFCRRAHQCKVDGQDNCVNQDGCYYLEENCVEKDNVVCDEF